VRKVECGDEGRPVMAYRLHPVGNPKRKV
jgi:hypothetical protein